MKEILRELREKNNLSQATVAEYLGVSRQMYMKYESGENEISVKMVVLLSRLYKVSYEQIIDNKIEKEGSKKTEYKSLNKDYEVASSTPVYGISDKKIDKISGMNFLDSSPMDQFYIHKFKLLNRNQKNAVGNLIEALADMNRTEKEAKTEIEKEKKIYRKPGGLTGDFYMADDFDETPECFKEYM